MNTEAFLVCVLLRPTKKQFEDDGIGTKVVVELALVLAADIDGARVKALMMVPDEYKNAEARLAVRVLPFPK